MKHPSTGTHKYYIVFNPVSGNKDGVVVLKTIKSFFNTHNLDYTLHITKKKDDIPARIKQKILLGYNVIVAVGGDGTISQVVTGIYKSKVLLGIIPTGSANTLARELGIPLEVEEACNVLLHPRHHLQYDVMLVKDNPHIIDISIGINALTMRDTKRKHKRIFGIFAYIVTAIKWMLGYQPRVFSISAHGETYSFKGSEVLIANGGILKNLLLKVIPHTTSKDGHMDVIVVRARGLSDYLRILWYLILNKKTSESRVERLHIKDTVTIDCNKELPVQADGDIIGKTPVTVTFEPSAIPIIVPKQSI